MRYNRHGAYENGRSIKNSRFPTSLFAIYLIVLLLMTGIHTGLILSVADTGCGMDQTSLQHIFDKFYQGGTPPIPKKETDWGWHWQNEYWSFQTVTFMSPAHPEREASLP